MRTVNDYLNLLAGEHRGKPKYEATVQLLTAPMVALQQFLENLPQAFDLDKAIGAQLDIDGIWIGRSRNIEIPLPDVFFSFDTPNLGFDQGVWFGPFTPSEGLASFDDETYRALLRTKIVANSWDGTASEMQQALQLILNPYPTTILGVTDNYDGSMSLGLSGIMPPRLIYFLVTGGYVPFKPEGVALNVYVTSFEGAPLFGLDVESNFISGLDVGAWGVDPSLVPSLPVVTVINHAEADGVGFAVASTRMMRAANELLHGVGSVIAGSSATTGTITTQAASAILTGVAGVGTPLTRGVRAATATLAGVGTIVSRPANLGQATLHGVGSVTSKASPIFRDAATIAGVASVTIPVVESPSGAEVVTPGQAILASTIPGTASANGPYDTWEVNATSQVVKNQTPDTTLSSIIALYYTGHFVYAVATGANTLGVVPGWYQYVGGANPWSSVNPPTGETTEGTLGVATIGGVSISGSGGGGGGTAGPTASGTFVNIDFTNLTSPGNVTNVTVYPQLFGAATGGMFNNNSSAMNNTTFQALVRALNLPLFRVGAQSYNATATSLEAPISDEEKKDEQDE